MKDWQRSPHSFHGQISIALVLGRVQTGYHRCCVFKHGNRFAEAGEQSSTFPSVFRNLLLLKTDIANHTEQTCDFTDCYRTLYSWPSSGDWTLSTSWSPPLPVPMILTPSDYHLSTQPIDFILENEKKYRYLLLFSGSGALPPSFSSSPHLPLCGDIQVLSQSMISRGPVSHAYWLLS